MTEYTKEQIEDTEVTFTEPEKVRALAEFLDIEPDDVATEVDETTYDEFEAAGGSYKVLTDDEADVLWDEQLESYIDDCLEIPEGMENYFDREAWKRDARMDGRGHCISSYDGGEDDSTDPVSGDSFVIFRTN